MLPAFSTPIRNKTALPHVHRTLPQGELFHRAIVGRVGNGRRVDCPELTGRDGRGEPRRDGHRHAHMLPLDLDSDQRIDHVLVYAPVGLGDAAQQGIRSLKRTWAKGGVGQLQVAVAGGGDLDALRRLPDPLDRRMDGLLGPPQGSRTWIGLTPFVPPPFVKPRGRNTIGGQRDDVFQIEWPQDLVGARRAATCLT
jgi:CRISPR-associated protein Csb2